jgi:hypothetical protein
MDETGSYGYTLNSDGTLTNFQISTTLQYKNQVTYYTTLPRAATHPPVDYFPRRQVCGRPILIRMSRTF